MKLRDVNAHEDRISGKYGNQRGKRGTVNRVTVKKKSPSGAKSCSKKKRSVMEGS
jgi:hypothetical protein